jgi:Flp pilus assembly pilin Flp
VSAWKRGIFWYGLCYDFSTAMPRQADPKFCVAVNMGSFNMFNVSSKLGRKTHLGQGMTEYIIIVALIAVAAIGVYSYFGQTLRSQTAGIASEIAGKDSTANITKAQDSSVKAGDTAEKTKSLGSYGSAAELSKK